MISSNTVFYLPPKLGIGDALQFSRHGEFFFSKFNSKMKLNYQDRFGLYSKNPYVKIVDDEPDIDLWSCNLTGLSGSPVYNKLSMFFDVSNVNTNIKPSMYIDNVKTNNKTMAIHTEGSHTQVPIGHLRTREIPESIATFIVDQISKKYDVVQIGGEGDYLIPNVIDIRGTSILELHNILSNCCGLICVDSGPMHVGACVGIPLYVYVERDISNKLWDDKNNVWLYKDSTFIGPPNRNNVVSIKDFVRSLNDN